jgi:hypothetical protein
MRLKTMDQFGPVKDPHHRVIESSSKQMTVRNDSVGRYLPFSLKLYVGQRSLRLKIELNQEVVVHVPSHQETLVHADRRWDVLFLVILGLIDIRRTIFGADCGLSNFQLETADSHLRGCGKEHFLNDSMITFSGLKNSCQMGYNF